MATKTWQFPAYPNGPKITIKAAEADVRRLRSSVADVTMIANWFRQLTGVLGEDEHTADLFMIYGKGDYPPDDLDGWQRERDALVTDMTARELTSKDIPLYRARCSEIKNRYIKVVDERETRDVRDAKNATYRAAEAHNKEVAQRAADAFTAKWGQPGAEAVEWGPGQMAVYLRLTYDNSDYMSDYFDSHAGYGEKLLLGVVRKGARTERIARDMVNKYPDLAACEYTWHEENYSMGHGNYLMGTETVGIAEGRTVYGGGSNPPVVYEVSFQDWAGKMAPYKDYGQVADAETETVASDNPLLVVEQTVHTQKNVPIWLVKIVQRVERDVYDQLASQARRYGGQWSRFSKAFLFYDASGAQKFVEAAHV